MNTKEINIPLYHDAGFSSKQMDSLRIMLEKNSSIHWLSLNDQGIFELVLDNQMFSTFRACPSHFFELYIEGWSGTGRSWNLDFGILFHKMVEEYYMKFREPGFNVNDWAIKDGIFAWNTAQMDFHISHKEYQSMGGVHGFVGLLVAYAQRFSAENERIRVIGTEIGFGKAKEVFIGDVVAPTNALYQSNTIEFLKCFLSGRIDVLIDDGLSICPMDHKTMGSMRFDPAQRFEMDEGPTGYIYAVNQILPSFLSNAGLEPSLLKRNCNKIVMNFVSKSVPKDGDRFRRIPIMKTDEQLESYRLRMLATSEDIFRSTVRYASTGVATRDTSKCTNWYMSDCPFLSVHRQNTMANELTMLNQFFVKQKIWDTENLGRE
jgi:PD-(D/E)XK nuclease superfamily